MAKQYEVVGKANVEGHDPGERFHADLEPAHEARMLKGGFLRVVSPTTVMRPAGASKTHAAAQPLDVKTSGAGKTVSEAPVSDEATPEEEE